MTSLRVKQISAKLLALFEKSIPLNGITEHDKDRRTKILSRCLAAFAVQNITGCTDQEAADSVWDGEDDNGIDAAFFDSTERQVVLVQSKWIHAGIGEPSAADISLFSDGIRDLIEAETDKFSARIKSKVENICSELANPGTTIQIILISTGTEQIAKHGTAKILKVMKTIISDQMENLTPNVILVK